MTKHTTEQVCKFLDTWLQYRTEQDGLSGFVVAIRQNEELIYEQTFHGNDTGQKLQPSTLFNIGSQTKLLTAALILQAAERGDLALDDSVVKFVPWLRSHQDPRMKLLTIEQLLWHGAGLIRDGLDADYWQFIKPFPDKLALRTLVLDSPLIMRSGYKLKYSNLGYALLGEVLSKATGMEYATLIKKYLAQPLGLESLTVRLSPRAKERVAPGYTERVGAIRGQLAINLDTKAFAPVIGCYATASDMTKLISEIVSGKTLLSADIQRKLISGSRAHWLPEEQRGSDYGLGVISQTVAGRTIVGHSGMMIAHGSATYTDPITKTTVAVASTSRQIPVNQILLGIFEVLNYMNAELAPKPSPNDRFTVTLQNLLGTVQIINLKDKIVSVRLDDWYPFDQTEELEVINDTTLKIIQAHDYSAEGELVNYTFSKKDTPISARYAGITMWQKDAFTAWLSENLTSANRTNAEHMK